MTIPVWVQQTNGQFTASVLGAPQLSASAATRNEAVAALRSQIDDRMASGELLEVEMPVSRPFAARNYTEEEVAEMRETVEQIYREREESKTKEFAE